LEENEFLKHSKAERVTSIILFFAIILVLLKLVYYDVNRLTDPMKMGFGIILGLFLVSLAVFKQFRQPLYKRWLRFMVYMPLILILAIATAVIIYFFQVIFNSAGNATDVGGE